jgi:pyruvate,water dikinase
LNARPALVRLTGTLGEQDRTWAGGKAVGLAALLRAGLTIPGTWLVPVGGAPDPRELRALAAVASRWAVRSSATVEDGVRRSYAGMFSSELDVPPPGLAGAIARVQSSAGSARVAAYREQAGPDAAAVGIAVLLQPFRSPARSGLWLGREPGRGRLEWVDGPGDALVSGTVTPHWEEWADGSPVRTSGLPPLGSPGQPAGAACLSAQAALGQLADLEFAMAAHGVVWLQFRPVTSSLLAAPGDSGLAGGPVVRGTPAAGGRATGRARFLTGPADPGWEPGGVLLTERTDPDWVPLMAEAAALVTAQGGMLCHAAIIARELGVPCVTGVGTAALRRLDGGLAVTVDGTAGTVTVVGSPEASPGASGG